MPLTLEKAGGEVHLPDNNFPKTTYVASKKKSYL
jgi:hypothetical protein